MIKEISKKCNTRGCVAPAFVSVCLLLCAVQCFGATTTTATTEWSGTRPSTWMAHDTTPAFVASLASMAVQAPLKRPGFLSIGAKPVNGTGMSQLDRCRDIYIDGMVLPGCWTFRPSSTVEAFEDDMVSPIPLLTTKGSFTKWAKEKILFFCPKKNISASLKNTGKRLTPEGRRMLHLGTVILGTTLLLPIACCKLAATLFHMSVRWQPHKALKGILCRGGAASGPSGWSRDIFLRPSTDFNFNYGRLIKIPGDGDCGYECVASYMNETQERQADAMATVNQYMSIDTSQKLTGSLLRNLLATCLFPGSLFYNAVVGDDLTAEELERAHRRAMRGRLTSDGWVQNEEFIVLGKLFNISIVVYADHLNPSETHWTRVTGTSNTTCYMYNHRVEKNNWYVGNHFDRLTDLRSMNLRSMDEDILLDYLRRSNTTSAKPTVNNATPTTFETDAMKELQDINPHGALDPSTVGKDGYSLSDERVDPTLSKHTPDDMRVVIWLYRKLIRSDKMPYIKNARYGIGDLQVKRDTSQHIENHLVGHTQSSKSAELAFGAWVSIFILGCVPIILVRNSGGKAAQNDMIAHLGQLNDRINKLLRNNFPNLARDDAWRERFLLADILDKEKRFVANNTKPLKVVIVTLNNATHLRPMLNSFDKNGKRKWFKAIITKVGLDTFEVRYEAGLIKSQCRELPHGSVKAVKAKNTPFEVGQIVKACIPDVDRRSDAILNQMSVFGHKFDGKDHQKRFVFLVDEADKTVSSADHKSTQGERFHYKEQPEYSSISGEETESEYSSIDSEDDMDFDVKYEKAVEARRSGGVRYEAFATILVTATDSANNINDDKRFRPHMITLDIPDNYVRYEAQTAHLPAEKSEKALFIQRKEVGKRFSSKALTKFNVYEKTILDRGLMSRDEWDRLKNGLEASEEYIDLGDQGILEMAGFRIMKNKSGTFTIRKPTKKNMTPEKDKLCEFVDHVLSEERQKKKSTNGWMVDKEGIEKMVNHMVSSTRKGGDAEYRHSLIITDKTKSIQSQENMLCTLMEKYKEENIAIATFNCKGKFLKVADKTSRNRVRSELLKEMGMDAIMMEDGSFRVTKSHSIETILTIFQRCKIKNVVVISGEIGGRGQSYHTEDHSRILTDMFIAFDHKFAHGEMWIQIGGRLNTIETFTMRGKQCPTIRLWANPVVHRKHKMFLRREVEQTLAVRTAESYDDGIASTPNIVVDHYQNGKPILLKSTRRKLHIAASKKRPFTVDRTTELPEEKYKKRCLDTRVYANFWDSVSPENELTEWTQVEARDPCHNHLLPASNTNQYVDLSQTSVCTRSTRQRQREFLHSRFISACISQGKQDPSWVCKTNGYQVCQACYDAKRFLLEEEKLEQSDFNLDPSCADQ